MSDAAKLQVTATWQAARPRLQRCWQWLVAHQQAAFLLAGAVLAVILFFVNVVAAAAVTAAWVALIRHYAQTDADRQRRITESFSKAIDQLASDKLEVRLGGIYLLERISQESPDDYWTVMETLTAFVRERTRRTEAELPKRVKERAYFLWKDAGEPEGQDDEFWKQANELEFKAPPAADIAAVLTVIRRRSDENRKRELEKNWQLDFSGAVLRWPTSLARISNAPSSRTRISKALTSSRRISKAPASIARISKAPTSRTRISKAPSSGTRISKTPTSLTRISKAPTSGACVSDSLISIAQPGSPTGGWRKRTAMPGRGCPTAWRGRRTGRRKSLRKPRRQPHNPPLWKRGGRARKASASHQPTLATERRAITCRRARARRPARPGPNYLGPDWPRKGRF
jgi:hypothetical protein